MKKIIISIIVIIVLIILGIGIYYYHINSEEQNMQLSNSNNDTLAKNITMNNDNSANETIVSDGILEVGTTERRGFIIDNVYHSESQGDIYFASYYPNGYDETKDYAIYFALPGWEGLYFQGVGANMQEPYPYEAQNYNQDMIIISPQLDDWGEESADDTIALVEYFLNNYNIDKSRVYISGASGGGETLSIVLGKRPELFTSALFISSQWDGGMWIIKIRKNNRLPSTSNRTSIRSIYRL